MSKRILAIGLFLLTTALSVITNLVTSDLGPWYLAHRGLVLAVGATLVATGVVLSVLSEQDSAELDGRQLRFGSILGAVASTSVVWAVVGAFVGLYFELFHRLDHSATWAMGIWSWVESIGTTRLACSIAGGLAGTSLRYAYYKDELNAFVLTGTGIAAGAFLGANYDLVAWHIGIPPPAISAFVGFAIGGIPAVFRPGYDYKKALDRERRSKARLRMKASVLELRRLGVSVHCGLIPHLFSTWLAKAGYFELFTQGPRPMVQVFEAARKARFHPDSGVFMMMMRSIVALLDSGDDAFAPPYLVFRPDEEDDHILGSIDELEGFLRSPELRVSSNSKPMSPNPAPDS